MQKIKKGSNSMIRLKFKKRVRDRNTGALYAPGDIVDFADERGAEILANPKEYAEEVEIEVEVRIDPAEEAAKKEAEEKAKAEADAKAAEEAAKKSGKKSK
jgi:hypothetical protein